MTLEMQDLVFLTTCKITMLSRPFMKISSLLLGNRDDSVNKED